MSPPEATGSSAPVSCLIQSGTSGLFLASRTATLAHSGPQTGPPEQPGLAIQEDPTFPAHPTLLLSLRSLLLAAQAAGTRKSIYG